MNILFLCHRIPFPPNKGDKIRSFNEIRYLSENHTLYLGTVLERKSDRKYVDILKKYCKEVYGVRFHRKLKLFNSLFSGSSFSVSNFYDKSLQKFVDKILKKQKIDVIICFCSSMAEYIFRNPLFQENGLAGTKLIMDFVDLDSDKWRQYASYIRFPMNLIYKMENKRLFRYEVKINKAFHHSVFVAQREKDLFKRQYPQAKNLWVIANGVDNNFFLPRGETIPSTLTSDSEFRPILVFTGVMDYFANEDGVVWFCRSIFPKIKAEFPQVQFYIVGSRPTKTVRNLGGIEGVTVTGYVDDVREYYWMADVCVIPLRIARGLQNKIIEAMASGNAVVASSNASEGIICKHNEDILIADNEHAFANKVIALLSDTERRKDMGRKALANINENYLWDKNLKRFDEILYK